MKKPILFVVLLLSTNFLFAQGSITFPSDPVDDNGIVDFAFDLDGGGAKYDLSVEVSFDGGTTWHDIPPAAITGTLDNVAPANGINLQWDAMASFPGQVTDEAVLRITAEHVCGTSFTFSYREAEVTYGTVSKTYILPEPSKEILTLCWFDRNLGATTDPAGTTTNTTEGLYGDLFQWGRLDDGHQDRTSTTTSTLSTTDVPGHDEFITVGDSPYDWRDGNNNNRWNADPQENNPCPDGWRVPTKAELEEERGSWDSDDATGAFDSDLKWPVAGNRLRSDGSLNGEGSGFYWSSTVSGSNSWRLSFGSESAGITTYSRAHGYSVRCLKDHEDIMMD